MSLDNNKQEKKAFDRKLLKLEYPDLDLELLERERDEQHKLNKSMKKLTKQLQKPLATGQMYVQGSSGEVEQLRKIRKDAKNAHRTMKSIDNQLKVVTGESMGIFLAVGTGMFFGFCLLVVMGIWGVVARLNGFECNQKPDGGTICVPLYPDHTESETDESDTESPESEE